jgi:hypothetical protein
VNIRVYSDNYKILSTMVMGQFKDEELKALTELVDLVQPCLYRLYILHVETLFDIFLYVEKYFDFFYTETDNTSIAGAISMRIMEGLNVIKNTVYSNVDYFSVNVARFWSDLSLHNYNILIAQINKLAEKPTVMYSRFELFQDLSRLLVLYAEHTANLIRELNALITSQSLVILIDNFEVETNHQFIPHEESRVLISPYVLYRIALYTEIFKLTNSADSLVNVINKSKMKLSSGVFGLYYGTDDCGYYSLNVQTLSAIKIMVPEDIYEAR